MCPGCHPETISLFEPIIMMEEIRFCDGPNGDDRHNDNGWLEGLAVRQALGRLGEREKLILSLRFFNGKTQMELLTKSAFPSAGFTPGEGRLKPYAKLFKLRLNKSQKSEIGGQIGVLRKGITLKDLN